MAQLSIGMVGDVNFEALPIVLIIANALAIHAHRQYLP